MTDKKKKTIKKSPTKPRRKVGIPTQKTSGKTSVKKTTEKKTSKSRPYFEAVGRRKQSTARVRLFTSRPFEDEKGKILVNDKPYTDFFTTLELQQTVASALKKIKSLNRFEATIKVKGGGIRGQAEAIRHGLSRALVKFNADFSKKLKRAGYLRRDPRKKERKKPGLKKARRAPQWKKR